MDIGIEGIKCDAEGCDYEDMDLQWGTTPEDILKANDDMLGKPCPKCGASLLTPEDHANVKVMVLLAPELTALEEELKILFPGEVEDKQVKVSIKMNGTGNVEVGDPEELE